MNFLELKKKMQTHVYKMLENQDFLFIVDVDKDELWNKYLDSFPEGTNKVFRKRREFDCSCCRNFVKHFGNVVVINSDYHITTIWDFNSGEFQPVTDNMSIYLKKQIKDVFISNTKNIGTDFNYEQFDNGEAIQWDHFYIELPNRFVFNESIGSIQGATRDQKNVFKRSLEEISQDAIETVNDLIAQKSLYKGEEWKDVLLKFLNLHKIYDEIELKDNFCWLESIKAGMSVSKIRNHSIGLLLTDITNGMELDEAVRRYERVVAPSNYKRPKAIFSKKMVEQAEKKIKELGLLNSLGRRFANIDDISINDIIFTNMDFKEFDIFDDLKKHSPVSPKNFNKVQEISIEKFIDDILPNISNIEILFENNHTSNLISLIAPKNKDSKSLLKWDNGFSWAYNGNITDSMKQIVKSMGGNIEGVLRFSIQWNEDGNDNNDLDAHCIEPNKNHIHFRNKGRVHRSSGILDVDIIEPDGVAVENITYSNSNKMPHGDYTFLVHCYLNRGGAGGFRSEIEFDDNIYKFSYNQALRQGQKIEVGKVNWDGKRFKMKSSLSSQSKKIWNLNTNQFHEVSVMMFSPNHWSQKIGHRHVFFMLKDCKNDQQPNGFFNEFLKEEFTPHRKVFEALGSKMKVEHSDNQLSGLGFSTTKRNNLTVKVSGNFTRMLKITF